MKEADKRTLLHVSMWFSVLLIPVCNYYNVWHFYFFFLAGISNGVMDTLQYHFSSSFFSDFNKNFWDATISWTNKYVVDGGIVTNKRRKILAVPIPVLFTDGSHLFKFLMLSTLFAGVACCFYFEPLIGWWQDAILGRASFGVGFYIYYNLLKK